MLKTSPYQPQRKIPAKDHFIKKCVHSTCYKKSGNPISKKFAHYEKLKGRALANKKGRALANKYRSH